jgi:hypothetical protein
LYNCKIFAASQRERERERERERQREREKVSTAVTFRVVMLSKSVTTPIR